MIAVKEAVGFLLFWFLLLFFVLFFSMPDPQAWELDGGSHPEPPYAAGNSVLLSRHCDSVVLLHIPSSVLFSCPVGGSHETCVR